MCYDIILFYKTSPSLGDMDNDICAGTFLENIFKHQNDHRDKFGDAILSQ